MIYCNEDEMQQHLLMDCHRAQEVWSILQGLGLVFNLNFNSVMYGLLEEKMPSKQKELLQQHSVCQTVENQMCHGHQTDCD